MLKQIRKEFNETPAQFSMGLLGALAVIYQIASSLFQGSFQVDAPPEIPTTVRLLGIGVVVKLAALLFIQWTIAQAQAWVHVKLALYKETIAILAIIVVSLCAAWLTAINLNWLFLHSTLKAMIESGQIAQILICGIAIIAAVGTHMFVLIAKFDAAEAALAKTPGSHVQDGDISNLLGLGWFTYALSLLFVALASFAV